MLGKILAGMGLPTDSLLWWSVIFWRESWRQYHPDWFLPQRSFAVTLMHKANIKLSFSGFCHQSFYFLPCYNCFLASLYLFCHCLDIKDQVVGRAALGALAACRSYPSLACVSTLYQFGGPHVSCSLNTARFLVLTASNLLEPCSP